MSPSNAARASSPAFPDHESKMYRTRTKLPTRPRHPRWREYRRFSESPTRDAKMGLGGSWSLATALGSSGVGARFTVPRDRKLLDIRRSRSQIGLRHHPLRATYGVQ